MSQAGTTSPHFLSACLNYKICILFVKTAFGIVKTKFTMPETKPEGRDSTNNLCGFK